MQNTSLAKGTFWHPNRPWEHEATLRINVKVKFPRVHRAANGGIHATQWETCTFSPLCEKKLLAQKPQGTKRINSLYNCTIDPNRLATWPIQRTTCPLPRNLSHVTTPVTWSLGVCAAKPLPILSKPLPSAWKFWTIQIFSRKEKMTTISNWTMRRRKWTQKPLPPPMQLTMTKVKVNRLRNQFRLLFRESKTIQHLWSGPKNSSKVLLWLCIRVSHHFIDESQKLDTDGEQTVAVPYALQKTMDFKL